MIGELGVVVASSELGSRLHLGGILMKLGLDPVCVPTLRDCHETVVRKNIGLIFCDAQLTDGSYTDLLSAFRRRQRKPRVVLTSRLADWDEFKEAMRWGAFDVVSSPYRPMDVEWIVIQARRDERNREKFQIDVTVPVLPNEAANVTAHSVNVAATATARQTLTPIDSIPAKGTG